jgi:hypothetical protein
VYESMPGRRCAVCGGPIKANNITGICRRNPDCDRKNAEAKRRRKGVRPWAEHKRTCEVEGCGRPHASRGKCGMHHQREAAAGRAGEAEPRKRKADIKSGAVFGAWTVLEGQDYYGQAIPCRCECGNERLLGNTFLLKGNTGSCICRQKGRTPGRPLGKPGGAPYVAAGEVYGRLTVLEDAPFSMTHIRVRCECGNETTPRAHSLKHGNTRSCGCLQLESRRTHGLSSHPLYHIWHGMISRCTNPDDKAFRHYGGRGITVCEQWIGLPDGLLRFAADMGERPPGWSVDRIDNDGGYEPGNCQWESPAGQTANRRKVAELTLRIRELSRENERLGRENRELRAENAALRQNRTNRQ